jgi:hypothetical protein
MLPTNHWRHFPPLWGGGNWRERRSPIGKTERIAAYQNHLRQFQRLIVAIQERNHERIAAALRGMGDTLIRLEQAIEEEVTDAGDKP